MIHGQLNHDRSSRAGSATVTAAHRRSQAVERRAHPFVRRYGVLLVKQVFTRAESQEVFDDISKLLRGGYDCPQLKPVPASMNDKEVMQSFSGIIQPHFISPVVSQYIEHPIFSGMLSQIVAAHLPFWDGSIKFMQSMVFVKPPGLPGQAWHQQDEIYIPTRDRSLFGAWIAFDDATIQKGCLYVIPRSRRSGYLWPKRKHERPGSFMSRSQIYRRAIMNHYMNAWLLLPWSAGAAWITARSFRPPVWIPTLGRDTKHRRRTCSFVRSSRRMSRYGRRQTTRSDGGAGDPRVFFFD